MQLNFVHNTNIFNRKLGVKNAPSYIKSIFKAIVTRYGKAETETSKRMFYVFDKENYGEHKNNH